MVGMVGVSRTAVVTPPDKQARRCFGWPTSRTPCQAVQREIYSLRATRAIALCTYLSAVLLVGLVLNSLFNGSWADPIAALVIAAIAVREGVNAWKGDPCCCTPSIGQSSDAVATCDCCSEDDGPCSC